MQCPSVFSLIWNIIGLGKDDVFIQNLAKKETVLAFKNLKTMLTRDIPHVAAPANHLNTFIVHPHSLDIHCVLRTMEDHYVLEIAQQQVPTHIFGSHGQNQALRLARDVLQELPVQSVIFQADQDRVDCDPFLSQQASQDVYFCSRARIWSGCQENEHPAAHVKLVYF
eukprot:820643-Amphidinium_carterae.1